MEQDMVHVEEALKAAVDTYVDVADADVVLLRQRLFDRGFGKVGTDELRVLQDALTTLPGLEDSLGRDAYFLHEVVRLTESHLAWWLAARAKQTSPAHALAELHEFATGDGFAWHAAMVLTGVHTRDAVTLANGVALVTLGELPQSFQLTSLRDELSVNPRYPLAAWPQAALLKHYAHPKAFASKGESPSSIAKHLVATAVEELEEARLCLAIAGTASPHMVHLWFAPAAGVPLPRVGQRRYDYPPRREVFATEVKLEWRSGELHESYRRLADDVRTRLRVSMKYLCDALGSEDLADMAIKLGIAMESFFLHDIEHPSELSYRLSMRAAHLLASTARERRDLFDLFRLVYDLRSEAVHTGHLSPRRARKPQDMPRDSWNRHYATFYYQELTRAAEYLSQAMRKVIFDGLVDMEALLFE